MREIRTSGVTGAGQPAETPAPATLPWDGGRLPTEAEWNYAAAAGSEQREYPWGATMPDSTYAVYNAASGAPVGSKSPKGDGKWLQADLAGNISEWNLDFYGSYPYPSPSFCDNCANVQSGSSRIVRGGSALHTALGISSHYRSYDSPGNRDMLIGARCARTP